MYYKKTRKIIFGAVNIHDIHVHAVRIRMREKSNIW